jgi:nucleotide-binding universal stress UspA family protein
MDVNAAARLAEWLDSSLLLVHVIAAFPAPAWLRRDSSARLRILVARTERRLHELAAAAPRAVRAEGRVVCGRIAEEIAAIGAAERIQLVTTALRDRRGWFGARRGSVSYSLLSHAVAPVLAYPPEWARGLRRTKRRTAF